MKVLFHTKAKKEIKNVTKRQKKAKYKLLTLIEKISKRETVSVKRNKQLKGTNLFEIRVRENSIQYRAIYKIIDPNLLILLVFKKDTNKTPVRYIQTAKNRLKDF